MDYQSVPMRFTKTVRTWGNVLAVPISRTEAIALGIRPGDQVDIDVSPHGRGLRLDDLPLLSMDSGNVDLDELAEDETFRSNVDDNAKAGS